MPPVAPDRLKLRTRSVMASREVRVLRMQGSGIIPEPDPLATKHVKDQIDSVLAIPGDVPPKT